MNPPNPLPHPRALAHLGDAVYELWVREAAIAHSDKPEALHKYTTSRVKAEAQAKLLEKLFASLTDEEHLIVKRAQNMPVTSSRRSDQALHRKSTGLEALVGYWYVSQPETLPQRRTMVLTLLEEVLATNPLV